VTIYIPKKMLSVIIVTALVAYAVTMALAHGGDTTLIHTCVNNSSGTIKIIASDRECANNETPLDWNPSGVVGTSGGGGIFTVGGAANINVQCAAPNLGHSGACDPGREAPLPTDGKLVSLAVHPYQNTNTSGGPATITVLVNGVPSILQIQIPAGSTSVQTVYADVHVQAGDLVTVQSHDPTGNGSTNFVATFEYRTN
jgi:hypothetical protein